MNRHTFSIQVGKNDPTRVITDRNGCSASIEKYFSDLGNSQKLKKLTQEEEITLISLAQKGDKEAEQKLFNSLARFVISIAKKVHKRYANDTRCLSLNDFIQCGNIGLLNAIGTYDPFYCDCRLISYSVTCIVRVMTDTFGQVGTLIRLPANQRAFLKKYRQLGEYNTESVVYGSNGQVFFIEDDEMFREHHISALRIPRYYHGLDDTISAFTSTNDELSFVSVVAESVLAKDMRVDRELLLESLRCDVNSALHALTEREAFILAATFGIEPVYSRLINSRFKGEQREEILKYFNTGMNVETIASFYSITTERVRQIREKAIGRLRNPSRSHLLPQYFELFY